MRLRTAVLLIILVSACAGPLRPPAAHGSRQSVRMQLPPDRAATCFARNAEAHSSALVAEIRRSRDSAEVIVRVKNGVLYGTANIQRAGSGSAAEITLMVTTTGRSGDLLDALTEGC